MVGQGLSDDEVRGIREALTAGRKPKVVFTASAGQIAGQVGQVVELTDPAVSDEFVVVRFGRDELPFSPADVAVAPRGAGRRVAEPKPEPVAEQVESVSKPEPEFVLDTPRVPAPRREESRVEPVPVVEKPAARRPAKAVEAEGAGGADGDVGVCRR